VYPEIEKPPLLIGLVHEMVACPFSGEAVMFRGALGIARAIFRRSVPLRIHRNPSGVIASIVNGSIWSFTKFVIWPVGVMRPMEEFPVFRNQIFPSGPRVRERGLLMLPPKKLVASPLGVNRVIELSLFPIHMFLSFPATIENAPLMSRPAVIFADCPAGEIQLTELPFPNHRFPSDPLVEVPAVAPPRT